MESEEAYKRLISAIDIAYYIGPAGRDAIRDACCGEEDCDPVEDTEQESEEDSGD